MPYSGNEKPSIEDLEHFGVKGMKWGVRKEDPRKDDFKINKGQKIYNISADGPRKLEGHVYGAHTKPDVINYRANFSLQKFIESGNAYSNLIEAKTDVRVASRDTQIREFQKLWDSDRKNIVEAIAQSQKNAKIGAAIMHNVFKVDRTEAYRKKYENKGKRWVEKKGFYEFNQALGTTDGAPIASDIMRKHYTKLGYNALLDANDVRNYASQLPIIYLTPKKSLKSVNTIELSRKDVSDAIDVYMTPRKFRKYEIHELHETRTKER